MNKFSSISPIDQSEHILHAIDRDGYAIVENLLSEKDVDILREQIDPHLELTRADSGNGFMGEKTLRFGRLLYRLPGVREIVRHPLVRPIIDGTLSRYSPAWQLHFTGVMHVMQGQAAQVLHRDSVPFPNPSPPLVLATMWAVDDFKKENGATVIVPGSHNWHESRRPERHELVVAEMPAGSVLLYAGNVIHGAGRCVTGQRTGIALQYSVSWLRQEENQYLAVPQGVARSFDEDLQTIMGYGLAARNWGYVDQMHALDFLNDTGTHRGLDLPGSSFVNGRVRALHISEGDVITEDARYDVTLDD